MMRMRYTYTYTSSTYAQSSPPCRVQVIGNNCIVSTETNDDFGESWVEILANNMGLDYAVNLHGYNRNNWQNRQGFPLQYDAQSFWPWWLRLMNQ